MAHFASSKPYKRPGLQPYFLFWLRCNPALRIFDPLAGLGKLSNLWP